MRAFALACFSILDQVVFDLNPCFNGRTIMVSKRWRLRRGKRWVLILILMEVPQWAIRTFKSGREARSLNPYSNGSTTMGVCANEQ